MISVWLVEAHCAGKSATSGDSSSEAPPDVNCGDCGAPNPAEYRFCENCGNRLQIGAQPTQRVREVPVPSPMATDALLLDRLQLRSVLLASGAFLISLALVTAALIGVQWAVAPLLVGGLSILLALGRMSSRSFALFAADMRTMVTGTPVATTYGAQSMEVPMERSTPQMTERQSDVIRAEPEAHSESSASVPSNRTEVSSLFTQVESAPAFRLWERQIGSAALIAGLFLMALSLYMFPKGPPNGLAWWSYGLSIALMLGAVPAFEGGMVFVLSQISAWVSGLV